jgi:hypothetical protein
MQYLIYFAVATPLVLAWLFWAAAETPTAPPLFHSFDDELHQAAALKQSALAERRIPPGQARPHVSGHLTPQTAPAHAVPAQRTTTDGQTQSRALSARPLPK